MSSGTVAPNTTYTFTITCTAPTAQAIYREDWRLVAPDGGTINVGSSPTIWAQIRVANGVLFRFGAIASPKAVNTPFQVTLSAVDAQGAVVTSYAGEVLLSSTIGEVTPTKVRLASGQWTGDVIIGDPAAQVALKAWDSNSSTQSSPFAVTGDAPLSAVTVKVLDWQGDPAAGATVRGAGLTMTADSRGFATGVVSCGQDVLFEAEFETKTVQATWRVNCDRPLSKTLVMPGSACNSTGKTPVILLPGILGLLRTTWDSPCPPDRTGCPGADLFRMGFRPWHHLQSVYGLFDPLFRLESKRVGWMTVIEALEQRGYKVGCTLFPAPYDWRLPIDQVVSSYLSQVIPEAKRLSGAPKVDIIAHSMGGLVARAYIQDSRRFATDQDVDARGAGPSGAAPHLGAVEGYHPRQGGDLRLADDRDLSVCGNTVGSLYENTVDFLYKQAQNGEHFYSGRIGYIWVNGVKTAVNIERCTPKKSVVREFVQSAIRSGEQLLPTFAFLKSSDTAPAISLPSGRDNDWLTRLNANAQWRIEASNVDAQRRDGKGLRRHWSRKRYS